MLLLDAVPLLESDTVCITDNTPLSLRRLIMEATSNPSICLSVHPSRAYNFLETGKP